VLINLLFKKSILITLIIFLSATSTYAADRTSCVYYESKDELADGYATSCWTVNNDRVEFSFKDGYGRLSVCCSKMVIVQGYNQLPIQGEYYPTDINYASLHIYDDITTIPIKECLWFSSTLATGEPFGWIDSFPPSFKINDSFSIYYDGGTERISVELPALTTSTTSITTTTTTIVVTTTTTTTTKPSVCAAEAVLDNDHESLALLRQFRDDVLAKHATGQVIIKLYYENSPLMVEILQRNPALKARIKICLDNILPAIRRLIR